MRWVKLGNENTTSFHTRATITYKHNCIKMLQNETKVDIIDHEGKASILWNAFKDRMGQSENIEILFNLQDQF
jgi:hypothetical protein